MNALGWVDTTVFLGYLALLVGVGVWFARRQKDLRTYLLADQGVHWLIVGISVLAALFSGISYLGAPAESFFHDLGYLWVAASFLIATPIAAILFLPAYRRFGVTTAYEYLELRFDRRLRRLASALFLTRVSFYLGLAIYAPALVIVEMTGWPFLPAALLTGAAATLYTTTGGMKAVVWTDALQFVVLCAGIVVVIAFAAAAVPGGLPRAWELAAADGKTTATRWSLDPTIRITVWSGLIGGAAANLVQLVTDQISVQRYLTAPTLRDSQKALWFKLWVTLPLVSVFYLTGTVLYGYYKALPQEAPPFAHPELVPGLPHASGVGIQNDRILPYFVLHALPSPLPGLLLAAIIGSTVAVVSAGINALATAALMDFRRGDSKEVLASGHVRTARYLTAIFGIISTIIAIVIIPRLGTLVQAMLTLLGLFGGPLLGLFLLGLLSRRANANGALVGVGIGGAAGALVTGAPTWFDYPISFMWVAFTASAATVATGLIASRCFAPPPLESGKFTFAAARRMREFAD